MANTRNGAPSLLAVIAHPDDEAFLMGGTLARYSQAGYRVSLLCLTPGDNGENALDQGLTGAKSLATIRKSELAESCRVLGVELLPVQDFPDGKLNWLPEEVLVKRIGAFIARLQPEAVLTFGPDGLTGHPDHIATYRATTTSFKEIAAPGTGLYYAGLPGTLVNKLSNRMEGNLGEIPLGLIGLPEGKMAVKIEIGATAALKWKALACHCSQTRSFENITQADRLHLSRHEYYRLALVAGAETGQRFGATSQNELLPAFAQEPTEVAA